MASPCGQTFRIQKKMTPVPVTSRICKDQKGMISLIGAGGKTSLMFRLAKDLADSGKTVLTTTTTKIVFPGPDLSLKTLTASSAGDLIRKSRDCLKQYSHFSAGYRHNTESGKLEGFSADIIDQLWLTGLFDWIIVEADGSRQKPLKATAPHEPVIPSSTTCLILVTGLDSLGLPLDEDHVHRASIFSKNTGLGLGQIVDEPSIAASIGLEMKKAMTFCLASEGLLFLNKADSPGKIASGMRIAGFLKGRPCLNRVMIASLKDRACIKKEIILHDP